MRKMILFTMCLLFTQLIFGQSTGLGTWIWKVEVGIEQHDKRHFDFPAFLFQSFSQNERWGTYHIGIDIQRRLLHSGRLEVFSGLGLTYEKATYRRPFESSFISWVGSYPDILFYQDRYRKVHIPILLSSYFRINERFFAVSDFRLSLLAYRHVNNVSFSGPWFPFSEFTGELENIQLRVGLIYRVGEHLAIGVHGRIGQIQKLDRLLFSSFDDASANMPKWAWHNPLMFNLSIGYTW